MSEINYNFSANYDSLGGIGTNIGNMNDVANEVSQVYQGLSQAYEGDGAQALQAKGALMVRNLTSALEDANQTTVRAVNTQDEMHQMDRMHAQQFS